MADPTFLGYFMDKGVDAAAKVVRKVIIYVLAHIILHFIILTCRGYPFESMLC